MNDDQVHQEQAKNELEAKPADEAIEDLEPDNEGSEAVKGGATSRGAGAGKVTF